MSLLLGSSAQAGGAFGPHAWPVMDLRFGPSISSAAGPEGIYVASGQEVYAPEGSRWIPESSPEGLGIDCVAPFRGGYIVSSHGASWVRTSRGWSRLAVSDFIRGTPCGDGLLLSGPGGVYYVSPELRVSQLSYSGSSVPQVFRWKGNAYFWAGDGMCYVYDGQVKAAPEFPWGSRHPYFVCEADDSAAYLDDGSLFVESAHKSFTSSLFHRSVVGIALLSDMVVVASYDEGLLFFSKQGSLLYHISTKELGGSLTGVYGARSGLLAIAGSSISFVPDPNRYTYCDLGSSDLIRGDVFPLGLRFWSGGAVSDEGTGPLPKLPLSEQVMAYDELANGQSISGGFGWVSFGRRVALWDRAREVRYIGFLTPHEAVGWHGYSDLIFVSDSGSVSRKSLPYTIGSVDAYEGLVYVGSLSGVTVYDPVGVEVRHFGSERLSVKSVKGGALLCWSSTGLYSTRDGSLVAVGPKGGRIKDVTMFKGNAVALVQFPDSSMAVGRLGPWRPYEIPGPYLEIRSIASQGDDLFLFGSRLIAKVRPSEFHLPPFSLEDKKLGPSETGVSLSLPRSLPAPWPQYSYQVRVGADTVTSADGSFDLPRFPFGRTPVVAELSSLGLQRQVEFQVDRARPWWLSWQGLALYVLGTAGMVVFFVRWRTDAARRRTRELEKTVAERTAELVEAQKAREHFFSSMSHEIRNPLNGVMGLADMLEESSIAGRERLLLRTLKGCARQLGSMLDDVLDFSKMERGEVALHEGSFELAPTIEGAIRAVDAALSRVTFECPASAWLYGDDGKIRQVVTNLVSNALKYGVPPQARVTVAMEETMERDRKVTVRVYNTGPTIAPEELVRIFEGVRGRLAVERRIGGYGLGLALSRRLAILLGGSLLAESRDGLTTFSFCFRAQVTAEPPQTADLSLPVAKVSKALVIEDEGYNRLVMGGLLAKMGYEVDWAVDLKGALERLRSESYDVAITDYRLPDGTGIDFAKAVRDLPAPRPPVIMVTAYSTVEKAEEARSVGILGFVSKPITFSSVQKALVGLHTAQMGLRSLDVSRIAAIYDFSPVLRFGRSVLAQFGKDVESAWLEAETAALLALKAAPGAAATGTGHKVFEDAVKLVHAFRSKVLVIHASTLADDLGLLERALDSRESADAARLLGVLRPQIDSLVDAATRAALS